MKIITERSVVFRALRRTGEILSSEGGFISPDLVVRESAGEFSCAVQGETAHTRILLEYAEQLSVPLAGIQWGTESQSLDIEGGYLHLTRAQRELLDLWLELVAETGKLAAIRRHLPALAVEDPALRDHLSAGGYPDFGQPPAAFDPRDTLIGWHSSGGNQQRVALGGNVQADPTPEGAPRQWRLIPLKHLVNHHPDGASQTPRPGRIAVVTSASSTADETFENYGDLDALHLLMRFGYVDSSARVVHSVPVTIESHTLGEVTIGRSPPRYPRRINDRYVLPAIQRTEEGLRLRYLSARQGNRPTVVRLLEMLLMSAGGAGREGARKEAEQLVDAVFEANVAYYRQLESLVDRSSEDIRRAGGNPPPIHADLSQVSHLQQARLMSMWGP